MIVANMERSLAVPTATSFRNVPAKLLEINRRVINGYLGRKGSGKVSFTHLIGYAVVRAIADEVRAMNNTFVEGSDGKPRVVRNEHVNLGLAVDVGKPDGSRTFVVPVLRDADTLEFDEFLAAYEEIIRKVRTNKLAVKDFLGATITLTNPGTIGTVQSVPRLMPGQGVIVGVGTIDYPAEWQGADERALGELGVSKVVTVTSTYDHRIIQGAESGLFLKRRPRAPHRRARLLPRRVPVARRALRGGSAGAATSARSTGRRRSSASRCRSPRSCASTGCAATSSPTSTRWRWKEPKMHDELDPATYGLTIWDLDREFRDRRCGGPGEHEAGRPAPRAAGCLLPHDRHRVHAHPGHRGAALDPGAASRASRSSSRDEDVRFL